MNLYAIVILVALGLDYLLQLTAKLLNLRALSDEQPAEAAGLYDAESYRRSQSYTRMATRFGLVTSTFDLAVLLIFWFAGGFQQLDLWLRGFDLSPILTGLLFIGILAFGKGILGIPFAVYSTFVIEERFGFNRTTVKTFVLDILKALALALVIGGPLMALLLWFFESAGANAWLFCWLAVTVITIALQLVVPIWILPLFMKFTPLEEGELRDRLAAYARSVDFTLSGIFVIDGSRRSSRANAFFTGIGSNKRIALFDTLLDKHSPSELEAVLAHEVGHYKHRHILKTMLLSIAHSGVTFYLLSIFLSHPGLFDAFGMEQASTYSGLVFFGLLYAPVELALALFLNYQSRRNEFEADRYAVDTVEEPEAMATALQKLATNNLSNLTPHPFHVFLNYSHPPVLTRLAAIRRAIARG
ncbi:MAG: M48 family metallopeptidase [Acidobacteriota bacterium]